MLRCQGAQNNDVFNHKLKSALTRAPCDHNARLSQTDGETDGRTITVK